jgi:hypothetical protein
LFSEPADAGIGAVDRAGFGAAAAANGEIPVEKCGCRRNIATVGNRHLVL